MPRAPRFKYRAAGLEAAIIPLYVGIVGLCVGSFCNVVIGRLPDDGDDPKLADAWFSFARLKRLAWPPSRCPHCGHQIRWYENVPVLSWLGLRGKCSSCKKPISPRYLLIELLMGALYLAAYARFGLSWELASALVFFTFLVPLIFIDAELWILPFELTLPGIALGIAMSPLLGPGALERSVLGAALGFIAFRVMEFAGWFATSRKEKDEKGVERRVGLEALGMGDKYLLAMIGAQVGWRPLLLVILFSSVQGAVVGLVRMKLTGRAGPEDEKNDEKKEEKKGADEEEEDDEPPRYPFTPSFLAPGLPLWKRLALVPVTLLIQDIPDSPPADESTGDVPDWEPQSNNLPFGPWIGLAGVEVMLLSTWMLERSVDTQYELVTNLLLGG